MADFGFRRVPAREKAGYVRRHFNSVVGTAASSGVCRACAGGLAGKQVAGDHRLRHEAIGWGYFFSTGKVSFAPFQPMTVTTGIIATSSAR